MKKKIEAILTDIIIEKSKGGINSVDLNNNLVNDYLFDSIDLIGMIINIEDRFGITIGIDELDGDTISDIRSLIEIIEQKLMFSI